MKTYNVQLGYTSIVTLEVEAKTDSDAILKARKIMSDLYDNDYTGWVGSVIGEVVPWGDADTAEEVE